MMQDDFEETFPPTELMPEHLLREWVARLRGGETGPRADGFARYIIHDFCVRTRRNEAQSNITLHWIAGILAKILDDGKPEVRKVFSLMPKPNHREEDVDLRLNIATWIKEAISRGYSRPDAIKAAAATFERDERTIRRDIKGLEDYPRIYHEKIVEEVFKQQNRPLPPVKAKRTRTK